TGRGDGPVGELHRGAADLAGEHLDPVGDDVCAVPAVVQCVEPHVAAGGRALEVDALELGGVRQLGADDGGEAARGVREREAEVARVLGGGRPGRAGARLDLPGGAEVDDRPLVGDQPGGGGPPDLAARVVRVDELVGGLAAVVAAPQHGVTAVLRPGD